MVKMKSVKINDPLIQWFQEEARNLPWRDTDDPYKIWVSEIMLQQTRVETVKDYYEQFVEQFPTVEKLASSTRDDVLKAWEGMGFYARARRLHKSAKKIVEEHNGEIPQTYATLKELPGVGDYTAAALESFAFGGSKPIIDGNVKRVMARLLNINNPINRKDTTNRIRNYLEGILEESQNPGLLSESIMELGALICKPSNPRCGSCPIEEFCEARRKGIESSLPTKVSDSEKPHYEIGVGVVIEEGTILISRRPEDKMLGGLWEFPGGKMEDGESIEETVKRELREELDIEVEVEEKIRQVPHEYSHLSINLHAFRCELVSSSPTAQEGQSWEWVTLDRLSDYAFPKANKKITEELRVQSNSDEERTQI